MRGCMLVRIVSEIVLSGDTGNGYRAYEMLDELSSSFGRYGYKMQLIPLAPAHAHNRTDQRIALINVYFTAIRRVDRIFGARQFADFLHAASNPKVAKKRKFAERSHIFFRVVVVPEDIPESNNNLGEMLIGEDVTRERVVSGVYYGLIST